MIFLPIRSFCRRPLSVPVLAILVWQQSFSTHQTSANEVKGHTQSSDCSRVQRFVSAAVVPDRSLLLCGIRTDHDNFTKETVITPTNGHRAKVSLPQRFSGIELNSLFCEYRKMCRKSTKMSTGILRPSEQNILRKGELY